MQKSAYFKDLEKAFSDFEGASVFLYPEIGSTNDEAKRYAAENTDDAVFIAASQTAGRGRLGRSFSSEGGGLYLSYLSHPALRAEDAIRMTVFAAVCLCEVICELTPLRPLIKWVNDVYVGGRKLAGILTEGQMLPDGSFGYAVCGIGVNVRKREFPEELRSIATDIESECGVRVDIGVLAKMLCERLRRFEGEDAAVYMEKYRSYSLVIGRRVTVLASDGAYEADAVSIDNDGALTVRDLNGNEKRLFTGEVSIKL